MLNTIIAIFIIFIFTLLIAILIWSLIRLNKLGLLSGFMRGRWLLSAITISLVIAFMVGAVAMLAGADWAVPLLTWTIYVWLAYVWLYNLALMLNMIMLLRDEEARSISHFMGRSRFFDELIEKTIALSKETRPPIVENDEATAHAVTDSPMEAMLNDEDLFRELFPVAIRKKMRSKMIGLIVQTIIFILILLLIR